MDEPQTDGGRRVSQLLNRAEELRAAREDLTVGECRRMMLEISLACEDPAGAVMACRATIEESRALRARILELEATLVRYHEGALLAERRRDDA